MIQPSASPWKSHILRSSSDSPSSSSESSSAYSSQTCSPWETCPGLAPASPDFPPHDIQDSYLNDASFLYRPPTPTLDSLSLYSPMSSALLLPPNLGHDSMYLEPLGESLFPYDDSPDKAGTIDAKTAFGSFNNHAHSWHSYEPPVSEDDVASPPSPSETSSAASSPPANAASKSRAQQPQTPASAGRSASGAFTFTKVSKRKIVKINYAEDGYDGDSDDEYSDAMSSKRARHAEDDFSPDDDDDDEVPLSLSRSGTPALGRRTKLKFGSPGSASAHKSKKGKRRHWCPRDACQTSFTRPTDLERHMASVHREGGSDANKCTFCAKQFSREDAVLRHENDSCPARPRKKTDMWK